MCVHEYIHTQCSYSSLFLRMIAYEGAVTVVYFSPQSA